MKFHKYLKMTNHYQEKTIMKWNQIFPDYKHERFVILEKVHGSSFGAYFSNDQDEKVLPSKKTNFISPTETFFNYKLALNKPHIKKFIEEFKDYTVSNNLNLVVYGELTGMQKEIIYLEPGDRDIFFFDIYDLDKHKYLSPKESLFLIGKELFVPILGFADNLEKALEFDIKVNSLIKNDSPVEGVVLRPFNRNYINPAIHEHCIIKKKHARLPGSGKPKFKKDKKKDYEFTPEEKKLSEIACEYVTDERWNDVVSHLGEPERINQLGKYIKEFLIDYRDDFLKDYEEELSTICEVKKILSMSNHLSAALVKKKFLDYV